MSQTHQKKHPPDRPVFRYGRKSARLLLLLLFVLKAFAVANLRLTYHLFLPRRTLSPAIIAVPLSLKSEPAIALLAFLISLAPETIGLDVSSDRRALYVHTLVCRDVAGFRRAVKEQLECQIAELFS